MKIQVEDERIAYILNKLDLEMHGGRIGLINKNRPEQLILKYKPDDFEIDAVGIKSISNSLNCDVIHDMNVLLDNVLYYFVLKDIRQIKIGTGFIFDIVYILQSMFDVSDSKQFKKLQVSGLYENIDIDIILKIVQESKVLDI